MNAAKPLKMRTLGERMEAPAKSLPSRYVVCNWCDSREFKDEGKFSQNRLVSPTPRIRFRDTGALVPIETIMKEGLPTDPDGVTNSMCDKCAAEMRAEILKRKTEIEGGLRKPMAESLRK
ncbi:MAG: hypothetical protein ABII71_04690 [Candidatus Micrarchaeota archaeon]